MSDRKVLIISMFLAIACDRTGNTEQQALDSVARAQNALDAKIYEDDLRKCRAKGKDAGSFDVYELCARDADAKYHKRDGGV